VLAAATAHCICLPAGAQVSKEVLESISTPDRVETSIGTLEFLDGAPYPGTAEKVYDYLDTMRGVDAFLKGMPGASLQGLIKGAHSQGAVECHQVLYFDKLMDSESLYLTGNTSTMYVLPNLDLERDGPTVLEAPAGMLGAFNDAWFRYVQDIGPAGPDKGRGGKYLVLPPGYAGEVPEGYFLVRPRTYDVWVFMRASIAEGLDAAAKNVKENLRIYPLARKGNPPRMEFISGSGRAFNTIHANDYNFYEHLDELIQKEPLDMLDPETRGLFASIGMEKGKPFAPDARMKKLLTDAVAIANAAARSIVWYPRIEGTMNGIEIYPDTHSAWLMGWVDKNVFFTGADGKTMNSDARVMFHYPYTAVTPAMAVTIAGAGSDYGIAYVDANKQPLDGSKTYKVHIPADPPAKDFWALTMYDNQTRSMLQTSQAFPTVGSQTEGLRQNADGSYDIYFGPKPPRGFENNWLETVPGKGWFVALRMYGPLEPWIEKTWRPGEIELMDGPDASARATPRERVRVTPDNYVRAESDFQLKEYVEKYDCFGKFVHTREPYDVNNQVTVRGNRDTLYSFGVFDLTAPLTVTVPDPKGRYQSLMVVSQDHSITAHYGPTSVTLTEESVGTRYAILTVRTFMDPNGRADLAAAHRLQDRVRVRQADEGRFEVPAWRKAEVEATRRAVMSVASTVSDTSKMFGKKEDLDTVYWMLGAALGWGGLPAEAASYVNVLPEENDGKTPYTLTVKDVPVDAFWSVTLYDGEGWMPVNEYDAYSFNNVTAEKNEDGSITIHFGGDPKQPNFLPIAPGWNYIVRLYQPRREILDGTWTLPAPKVAE
jgi:hypothetical protein